MKTLKSGDAKSRLNTLLTQIDRNSEEIRSASEHAVRHTVDLETLFDGIDVALSRSPATGFGIACRRFYSTADHVFARLLGGQPQLLSLAKANS